MLRWFSSPVALLVLLCASGVAASRAHAQVDAEVADLNSQAMEAYQALDMDAARAKLEQAIGLAQQNGLMGPLVAQSWLNLGVVQITGFNDPNQGVAAFVAAFCTQPDVQLDPLLSTPDVAQAFAQAQQDAQSGACGPAPGPQQPGQPQLMPQQVPPGPVGPGYEGGYGSGADTECPPGVVCNTDGSVRERTDFARFFVNVQLGAGFAYVGSGMEADSAPTFDEIFDPTLVDNWDMVDMMTGVPGKIMRNFFDLSSAWVPDKDSYDDYIDFRLNPNGTLFIDPGTMMPDETVPRGRTPAPGNCSADGTATGPLDVQNPEAAEGILFTEYMPSKYCVRVEQPGIVANLALRGNFGYFLSDSFALSLPLRFQFNAGTSSFSHMLIGLRGEYLFSPPTTATGFLAGFFFGATYGQIQVKPPPKDPLRAAPYAKSGPVGAHVGVNLRYRLHRNFGLIVSPEVDVQFPGFLFNMDLMGGAEGAF
ncbi:MAG TPA: hypothetical protein VK509_20845 [Polyangiales bacterium]|nr:hypothetical protein [Polyangiales bacterium]